MNPQIFREYDIRGMVDEDLTQEVVEAIGKAYGTYVKREGLNTITCGRDGRTHSERIQGYFIDGVRKTGVNVINIGECPTPLLYFSIFHLNTDGGAQITGSHNPPEFNGFKLCVGKETLYGAKIQELRQIIESHDFETGEGTLKTSDIITPYINYMKENINIERPLKIVVDAGNGVAGLVAPRVFEDQGADVVPLFCEVDGNFPNHHPDPTVPKNLEMLIEKVKEVQADLGVAYDGDGDRLGVVDEKGGIFFGDQLLMIFSRDLLKSNPGATIIGEVKCSQVLYDDIEKHGGRPIMWKTGHSLIKKKMKEENALLAGEMSGHIFFADRYFGFDDGIYASLRFAEILSRSNSPASELLKDVPKTYSTPEIRVDCPEEIKFKLVERLVQYFKDETEYKVVDVDGVRVIFPDGWGLVRASNTQPVLVLRFEATSPERMEEIRKVIEEPLERLKGEFKAN
ncbi:Phosphoglucomutase [Dissulfuribacter thermophilus]|uniref:Phosphoglucomutase n=1 Tax=Dissulfuribacter thermophilus TaxID=1156395 RepID=A0A1B9F5K7_9BACT|nr:phosphomannomutase/phosphoglucomutase [Dissulfuribacter thermophilus]OCC15227.1 Phosphoglucomutase [Dissulfuribacter thermophilus]